MNTTSTLWYNSPAKAWTQSLPIGNGTLGAMVFGSPAHERLALNHDELWTGRPKDTVREGAPEVFVKARSLALEGKLYEAEELIEQDFLSVWSQAYMPLGDLELEFSLKGRVKDYRRSLDLEKAVAAVEFTCGQKKYKREYFAS